MIKSVGRHIIQSVNGEPNAVNEERANEDLEIEVDLGGGEQGASGCGGEDAVY